MPAIITQFLLVSLCKTTFAWDDRPASNPESLLLAPHHVLRNSILTAVVALPSEERGFYRGRRFEGGLVAHVASGSQTFVGSSQDDGQLVGSLGLSGEFVDLVVLPEPDNGTATSQRILRIGVGLFEAPVDPRAKPSEIQTVKIFDWKVVTRKACVHLHQEADGHSGYAYRLEKEIAIDPEQPILTVSWRLVNTGSLPIVTRHYSHNWLMSAGETRSPNLRLRTMFDYIGQVQEFSGKNGFRMQERELVFLPGFLKNPNASSFLSAPGIDAPNAYTLTDIANGAKVEIHNNWRPFDFVVYVDPKGFCPESFIAINLAAGEEKSWQTTYRFVATSRKMDSTQ